jgi:hypothetical protein
MFLFLSFMYFLLQNQRTGGQNRFLPGEWEVGTGGKGEVVRKGVGG